MLTALQESFWDRLGGVITLKRPTYENLQRDPTATSQAWLIILFLGLANGIALIVTPVATVMPGVSSDVARTYAGIAAALTFDTTERQLLALAAGIVGAVVSWYLSSWLLCAIGNRVAASGRDKVSSQEMRRLVGWGYAPSLASFLAPIPLVGPLLATLGTFWALVTGVMAVRAAFDVGIWKAIAIEIAAFLVVLVVVVIVVFITVIFAWPAA
jgi:hypothetical protein